MQTETNSETPEWEAELRNFDSEKINRIEEEARQHLSSEGRVWTADLAKNKMEYTGGYSESTLIQGLKLIRRKLEAEGVIEIEKETGDNPNVTRKVWVKK
jgi:hypothetical protein